MLAAEAIDHRAAIDVPDLAGRTVAIVHPAWHSCGTYAVVLAQIAAYRRLGARVVTTACSDQPGFISRRSRLRRDYITLTPELDETMRLFAGAPVSALARPNFIKNAFWPYLHLDQAAIRSGMAEASRIIGGEPPSDIALVHCNHFFCMPVAQLLAPHARTIVETHDIQADQFSLLNKTRRFALSPHATRDDMLRHELKWLSKADAIIHLNDKEERAFADLLPRSRHELIYPAILPMPKAEGSDIIVVASDNPANAADIAWLLSKVLPLTPDMTLHIYGTVDRAVAALDPALHARYAHVFRGRVDDLRSVYERAGTILLPCRGGHGLSIKALEALSSGARVVATTHAFRGMVVQASAFPTVAIADNALAFAQRILVAQSTPRCAEAASASRRAFLAMLGADAYAARLGRLAITL